ncbi:MAG: DNA polymerase III subunit alpha, partial [Deltaproteobacteria bacterium]
YSFCKPHSASYTLVAYKSAYLRAHYPAEFMASVISNGGGYYSTFGYLSEARRMGLEILPPDINQSEIKYTGKDRKIRVGLMQLKDLSQEAMEVIIHERSKHGPFLSLEDFLDRTRFHLHLQDVRILIKAGCFDSVAHGATRPGLMWRALRFFDTPTPIGTFPFETNPHPALPSPGGLRLGKPTPRRGEGRGRRKYEPTPYPRKVMLRHEMDTLGFLLSIHPLDRYKDLLKRLKYVRARDLHDHVGKQVTTIGWQITSKTVHTIRGELMKFVSFEDQTGIYETVLFPRVYNQYCHMLNGSRPYILRGKVDEDLGAITVTVHWIKPLGDVY